MNNKEFLKNIHEFKEDVYTKIGRDKLILYTVAKLKEEGVEPLFDEITVFSFKSFPKAFSLISFSEFPDSRTVANTLWHCIDKSKGWLLGNPKSGYALTDLGKEILKGIQLELEGQSISKNTKIYNLVPDRKESHFIKQFKKSRLYTLIKNKDHDIEIIDIKNAIGLSSNADKETTISQIEKFIEYAKRINDKDAENALISCKKYMK